MQKFWIFMHGDTKDKRTLLLSLGYRESFPTSPNGWYTKEYEDMADLQKDYDIVKNS